METNPPRRRRIDAASKLLFTSTVLVDLVRIEKPALAQELDLDAVEPLPTEYIDATDRSRRIGDIACRIPFAAPPSGQATRRWAFVGAEFQDRNDDAMLGRMREYTHYMIESGTRQGFINEQNRALVTLPFVIHTGTGRWRAPHGGEYLSELPEAVGQEVAPHQREAYILVDIGGDAPLPPGAPDNRFLAAARLVRCRTGQDLLDQTLAEWKRFSGDRWRSFRAGMHAWAEETLLAESGLPLPPLEEMENAKETEVPQLHVERGLRWREEWREEGIVAGVRRTLLEMAEERFGENAAQSLAATLEARPTPETFATVRKLMFACDTAEEFVERLPA